MNSPLAEAIFDYVSGRLSKEHHDGEGSHFIYLTEIERIIQKHNNPMTHTTATDKPVHGGHPNPSTPITVSITHAQMVAKLIKSGAAVLSALTETGAKLMHATFGISGEAGELLDAVKKHIIYGKPLDRENVIEELGDLEFYLEDLRATLGITREETIQANMAKLAKRYPNYDYTDASAIARADKA
jgi:NTP pyrophosphatase (non-canonical NTP hydrolase)